jgi:membrane-bound serine protease (ClpP class)
VTTRSRLLRLLLLALPLLATPALAQEPAPADDPVVTIVQLEGGIDQAYGGFLRKELRRAAEKGDVAVLVRLDSSGTIKTDAAELIRAIETSPVPVGTWVGERGAHVAGAATRLWRAGDVRMIAAGCEVRPDTPIDIGGGAPRGETRSAEQLFGSGEAVQAGTLVEAVRALIERTNQGLDPADVVVRFTAPGPVLRVRQALATNPTLVYLLLLTGIGAIVFELFQPGFGPAGYAGGLLVLLASYGLVALPTNPVGLALLVLGTAGMAYDVRRNTLWLPTVGGAVAMALGSWFLVHGYGGELRPALWAIILGVGGNLVFYGVVMTVVLRALRGQSANLGKALVGRLGEVRSPLNPQGHVLVEGALWRARALEWDGPVAAGTPVRVTGVDEEALLLDVEPIEKGS